MINVIYLLINSIRAQNKMHLSGYLFYHCILSICFEMSRNDVFVSNRFLGHFKGTIHPKMQM